MTQQLYKIFLRLEIRELGHRFSPLMPGHENIMVLNPYSANQIPRGAWRTYVSLSPEKVFWYYPFRGCSLIPSVAAVNVAGDVPCITLALNCRGTLKWRDGRNHVGDFREGLEHG